MLATLPSTTLLMLRCGFSKRRELISHTRVTLNSCERSSIPYTWTLLGGMYAVRDTASKLTPAACSHPANLVSNSRGWTQKSVIGSSHHGVASQLRFRHFGTTRYGRWRSWRSGSATTQVGSVSATWHQSRAGRLIACFGTRTMAVFTTLSTGDHLIRLLGRIKFSLPVCTTACCPPNGQKPWLTKCVSTFLPPMACEVSRRAIRSIAGATPGDQLSVTVPIIREQFGPGS